MSLYTKNGRPLQLFDDKIYSKSGKIVGQINGNKVYGTNGRYVGTIISNRLVYRSIDSVSINSPFSSSNRTGTCQANTISSTIMGDEPNIPD
jgi:hypothetical protein